MEKLYSIQSAAAEAGISPSRVRQLIEGQLAGDKAYPPSLTKGEHWTEIDRKRFVTQAGILEIRRLKREKAERLAERRKLAKKMRAKK